MYNPRGKQRPAYPANLQVTLTIHTYTQEIEGNAIWNKDMMRKVQSNIHNVNINFEKSFPNCGFNMTIIDIMVPTVPKMATISRVIPLM